MTIISRPAGLMRFSVVVRSLSGGKPGKKEQRWLWHAIDYVTGMVLAYVLAQYKDEALVKLVNLLKPFEIKRFFTDAWVHTKGFLILTLI